MQKPTVRHPRLLDHDKIQSLDSKGVYDQIQRTIDLLQAELSRCGIATTFNFNSLFALPGIHPPDGPRNDDTALPHAGGGMSSYNARKIRAFLAENLARKVSVAEMAATCDLSPSHFTYAFTRTFRTSPHKYLVDMRLDFAMRLLADRNPTIAEVAYHSGFSSQSHLTAVMRKHKRMTPAQIRQAR